MDFKLFIVSILSFQVLFIFLDLFERFKYKNERTEKETLRGKTVFFFFLVVLVFLFVQSFFFRMVPSPYALFDFFATGFNWLFTHIDKSSSLSGKWLMIISIITFYLSGLYDYLIHRFISHSRLLWWTHEYHHLPSKVFNLMPGLVARPFAIVLVYPNIVLMVITVYLLLWIFNLPLMDVSPIIVVFLLQGVTNMITHSSFCRRYWIFHYIMKPFGLTTPQEHIIHHGVDKKGNYANLFTMWDRLLNTYVDPKTIDIKNLKLGLNYDQDFLGTITLGKFKFSDKIRDKYQIGRYTNLYDDEEKKKITPMV